MHRDGVLASSWQRSCHTSKNETVRLDARDATRVLIGLAIALYAVALGFELAHLRSHHELHYRSALLASLGGVLLALGAATLNAMGRAALPHSEEARHLALQQVLFHALAIVLFLASAAHLHRGWSERAQVPLDTHVAIAFSLLGLVAITIAVALGWALAHSPDADPRLLRPRLLRRHPRPLGFRRTPTMSLLALT